MRTLRLFALVLLAIVASTGAARADEIFVTNIDVPPNFVSTIGAYTTSGATVNPALISGLNTPLGIAVSGSNLFVANQNSGTVGEYTTSGDTVNPALISGLDFPRGIAISGSDLFVVKADLLPGFGTIGQYTTSGDPVNPALISGLSFPSGIAVVPTVPEPSSLTLTLFGLVLAGLGFGGWRKTCQKTYSITASGRG